MSFDEQPDGDIHGECAAEIRRLEREVSSTSAVLRMANDRWERACDIFQKAQDQLDACRPHMEEGETVADALKRLSAAAEWQPIATATDKQQHQAPLPPVDRRT